ncbi:hypothetical protein PSCFBP3800_00535 [Pseudomonas syringae group genomosp. 3]|nr:hypothetical protein PSCFBP3800_00535 [Pseudomonas syringae group genomosp. 3]
MVSPKNHYPVLAKGSVEPAPGAFFQEFSKIAKKRAASRCEEFSIELSPCEQWVLRSNDPHRQARPGGLFCACSTPEGLHLVLPTHPPDGSKSRTECPFSYIDLIIQAAP